jgi:hypothetical protein
MANRRTSVRVAVGVGTEAARVNEVLRERVRERGVLAMPV